MGKTSLGITIEIINKLGVQTSFVASATPLGGRTHVSWIAEPAETSVATT
jgi:hypothetical protein